MCGEKPDEREVDPDRQARQKVAKSALEVLESDSLQEAPESLGSEPLGFFPRLEEFAKSFTSSLVETAQNASGSERLIAAVEDLLKLQAEVTAAPRLRPWIATWRAIDEVLERLRSVARHYLLALAAQAPIDAQREAESAQIELDAAAEPAVLVGDRMERWSSTEAADTFDEGLAILTGHAFGASGAPDLPGFDRAGAAMFERVTGRTGCPRGLGFGLNIIAQQAEGPFDEERFWRVAKDAFVRLTADEQWLADLLSSGAWTEDFRSAMVMASDGGVLNQGMAAAVRRERQAVRVSLGLVESLIETPGKMFAATLMAAAKKKDYESYRTQSAGSLIEQVRRQPGLTELVSGLDPAVRRASAHKEFSLEGDTVILMNRGKEVDRLSRDELVDRTFASIESVNAIEVAMVCAAAVGGLDPDRIFDNPGDYMDPATAVALLLAGSGWRVDEVSIVGDTASVVGEAEIDARSLLLASTILPHLPNECQVLHMEATNSTASRELGGPLKPLTQAAGIDNELEKQIYLLEARRLWRLDGIPLCSDDQVRKAVSAILLQRLSQLPDAREGVRLLLSVRAHIKRLGLSDLEEVVAGLIRALRGGMMGVAAPGELEVAIEPLTSLASRKVPPFDS